MKISKFQHKDSEILDIGFDMSSMFQLPQIICYDPLLIP